MIRLFIALPLTKKVEDKLNDIISQMEPYGGRVKYVKPENIHLTLKFLGNTDDKILDDIKKRIEKAASSFKPIKTKLSHLGTFPNWYQPRVMWVGMDDSTEKLSKLADKIDASMEPLGWERENKIFRSHLTIARIKDMNELGKLIYFARNFKFEQVPITFDRVTLYQSTLTKQGPIYKVLHEVKLAEKFG